MTARAERPLLYVIHALADEGWVLGRMLPALGLAEGQYRTQTGGGLGALQIDQIVKAVEDCRFTAIVVSSAWDRFREFAMTLALHVAVEAGDPKFVVITRGVPPESLSLGLRVWSNLDCADEEKTKQCLGRLRKHLDLAVPIAPPRPESPYPGLAAFTEDNGPLLFGREADSAEVVRRIHNCHRRILLHGPSGVGMSSLIDGAVLPALPSREYLVKTVARGGDPLSALRASVAALEIPDLAPALDAYLQPARDGTAAEAEIVQLRAGLSAIYPLDPRRRIVVVDSLEAVLDCEDAFTRTAFFHVLGVLWSQSWCTVILCMRSDSRGLLVAEPCWHELEGCQYAVRPLEEAGLRAAIEMPARRAGVYVDPALVEWLVHGAGRERSPLPLPLLQLVLEELWAGLEWRYLKIESSEPSSIQARRVLVATLAAHAGRVLQSLTEDGDQDLALRILLDFVQPVDGHPDARRQRTLRKLRWWTYTRDLATPVRPRRHRRQPRLRADGQAGQFERVLGILVEGRLITAGAGDPPVTAERHFDLVHDALITGWPALATCLEEGRAALLQDRRLEVWLDNDGEAHSGGRPSRAARWMPWAVLVAALVVGGGALVRSSTRRPIAACEHAARSESWQDDPHVCLESYEVTRDPQDLRWAAESFMAAGDLERGGEIARRIVNDPSYVDGLRILSDVNLRAKPPDTDAAQRYASLAFDVSRRLGDEHRMMDAASSLSKAAHQAGDFTVALSSADQVAQLAERLGEQREALTAQLLRADVLRHLGDTAGVETVLAQAHAINPCDSAWAHLELGRLDLDTGRDGLARHELARAEDSSRWCGDPAVSRSIDLAMAWWLRRRDPAGALGKLDAVSRIEGESPEALLLRGYLAADRGALAEADALFTRAEAIDAPGPAWGWRIAYARAELAELRGGPYDGLLAEQSYRRAIAMIIALRGRAQVRSAYLMSSHRGPYDGLIGALARAGRWRDVLAVVSELDASDMLRAAADARDRAPLELMLLPSSPSTAASPPATIEATLAAWRSRDLVVVIAPARHQIGAGKERAYRLRLAGGQVTGEDIGDASAVRQWAEELYADPGDKLAARALGRILVPPEQSAETLDVLALGALGKVPLPALRDEAGQLIIARRPLARVLSLRPGAPSPRSTEPPVIIADSAGDLFNAGLEGYSVASLLGPGARASGAYVSTAATRAALWTASRAELLHVAGHAVEQGGWRALLLSDGTAAPDEIVQRRLAPRLAVLACSGSAAAHDEEGWGSLAAALLEAGTSTVIAADRTLHDAVSLSLMRAFYAQAGWRTDPARALARAQRIASSDPALSVSSWATFTVLRRPPSQD